MLINIYSQFTNWIIMMAPLREFLDHSIKYKHSNALQLNVLDLSTWAIEDTINIINILS